MIGHRRRGHRDGAGDGADHGPPAGATGGRQHLRQARPGLRGRLLEGAGDAIPQAVRWCLAAHREQRRDLAVIGDLGPGAGVRRQVGLDAPALDLVDGVERVGAEQLVQRLVARIVGHDAPPAAGPVVMPAASSSRRSRRRPLRIRLLIVPSGSARRTATSRYV